MLTGQFAEWVGPLNWLYGEVVYCLRSPEGRVRYVGRTSAERERRYAHKCGKRFKGCDFQVLEVCRCHAGKAEHWWIRHFRRIGEPLENIEPYDDGLSARQRKAKKMATLEAERTTQNG